MKLSPFAKFFSGLVIFFSCLGSHFSIEDATYSEIRGGMKEAGIMLDFSVDVEVCKSDKKLEFKYIYARHRVFGIELIDRYGDRIGRFSKKDLITLKARGRYKPEKSANLPKEVSIPDKYKGEQGIIYKLKGKQQFKPIEEFRKTQQINAP